MVRALVLALLAATPAVAATPAAEQIAWLNAQRVANGIPGGIVEVPEWSEACRRHMAYIAENGGEITHEESPSNPGYSEEGAEIGRRAVLSPLDDAFDARGNAFEFAPIHLIQVLSPMLSRMGVWGGCATTIPGFDRRASRPTLYTYPGDGATDVYRSMRASELPFVPGDFVGLPQGTTTGPHIYLLPHGASRGRIASAAVSGPSGPVEIRAVDDATPGLEGYLPAGGIIIPVAPLAAGARYTVTATFAPAAGAALSRTWSFRTAGPAPTLGASVVSSAAVSLRLADPRSQGRTVKFRLLAGAALAGRRATITTTRMARTCRGGICRERPIGRRLRSVIGRLATSQIVTAPRPGRRRSIRVVAQTQAFESGGVMYAAGFASRRWSAR